MTAFLLTLATLILQPIQDDEPDIRDQNIVQFFQGIGVFYGAIETAHNADISTLEKEERKQAMLESLLEAYEGDRVRVPYVVADIRQVTRNHYDVTLEFDIVEGFEDTWAEEYKRQLRVVVRERMSERDAREWRLGAKVEVEATMETGTVETGRSIQDPPNRLLLFQMPFYRGSEIAFRARLKNPRVRLVVE